MPDPKLYLYGTAGCHLCDLAEHLIMSTVANAPGCLQKVDISESDALLERYGTSIPVLKAQSTAGNWLDLQWPFDQQTLIHFLGNLES